jgi:acyl transferase domain-containing protein/acyl-CoA synthetase (AMP-forming)/AMP-acid ligase II/pimeloyl-ACP methyl ester carboxylesterase/acyl carrier protein
MIGKFSTFVDLLRDRTALQSDKVAFTFLNDGENPSDRLTYGQLQTQAMAIASQLQEFKGKGERALLLYQPGLEFIAAFLGCLYAGVIAVPAYPPRANRSLDRLLAIVEDAQAKFALTTASVIDNIKTRFDEQVSIHNVEFIATDTINLDFSHNWVDPQITTDSLAFLQYTSGSTGIPKGVMVNHRNLLHNSSLINRFFQDTPETVGFSWLPPYHDMGLIGGILQPLYANVGSMLLMSPVTFLQRPYRWLQGISNYGVTTSGAPNFAYDLCVSQISEEQKATLDLSSWTLAFSGAEPVRAETLKQFSQYFADCGFKKEAFYPCYGMAETTLIVSGGNKWTFPTQKIVNTKALEKNQVIPLPTKDETSTILVSSGGVTPDQKIIIVNPDTFTLCKQDEIGEIWVQSDSVAQGYWNRREQTEATFKATIKELAGETFLRTGDLGFLQGGELFVTGRLKDLIIIRGRNHYPQDIELTIDQAHPAVRQGAGAAVCVEINGEERLVITQEIQRSYIRKLNVEEVTKAIRQGIVENHELLPFAILLLKTGTIPKTSSGKIQRHACRDGFLDGSLTVIGQWKELSNNEREIIKNKQPKSPLKSNLSSLETSSFIENYIIEKIAERLGLSATEIDPYEPFASYGLDSLQAVRLSAELEDWLKVKIPPTILYDYPNINTLSQYLLNLTNKSIDTSKNQVGLNNLKPPLTPNEEIAIVGLGCRFPGAKNPQQFWQLLTEGKEAITSVQTRWNGEGFGGFIENVDQFDPHFFGISPRETQRMDPQQRLLLEVSWEAFEYGGIKVDQLAGSNTGVFIGMSSSDYSQLQLHYGVKVDAYAGTGNAHSIAANRLSYIFDFRGPSLTIDTACSSSLVAVHLAAQSLQKGECDQAIAGGVNLMLSPELTDTFSQAGMLSPDGKCKTFDASADGYVRGEGCGVIVLKRLSQAQRDGNLILGVIKGSAINQDGRSNGLTAPNGLSQQEVIRQALINGGVNAQEINYIEAHGTGTSLGDPIEVNSLIEVLKENREENNTCYIGSVKTNIGHLEAAAGIAGLIKTILSLYNRQIPPHLNFNKLNPLIKFENQSFAIPTNLKSWENQGQIFAGVSSFGFGGTNAHITVSSYQLPVTSKINDENFLLLTDRPLHILNLSAKNESGLKDLVKNYDNYLTNNPDVNLKDLCFSANTTRVNFNHRLAIVTDSKDHLKEQFKLFLEGKKTPEILHGKVKKGRDQKIAFLFTGQGSQYVKMGYQLYKNSPIFRDSFHSCAEILTKYLDISLIDVLYGEDPEINRILDQTAYTQPALFALEYALAKLWMSWGIIPSVVMGHSVGEYVAACIAGVFSLEDGLKLIAARGKLMQSLPENGAMVAIFADQNLVETEINKYQEKISIAAYNGSHIVVSGKTEIIEKIALYFENQDIKVKRLNVSHGFHSPLMLPMIKEFENVVREINFSIPNIALISNVTGDFIQEEITTVKYWIDHILKPVKFASSIEKLNDQEYKIFLEIGAKPTLLGMAKSIIENFDPVINTNSSPHSLYSSLTWLPSLRNMEQDWLNILESLAKLSVRGIQINWKNFDAPYLCQKIILPTYPFQRQRYWLKDIIPVSSSLLNPVEDIEENQSSDDWFYEVKWLEKEGHFISNKPNNIKQWIIFADNNGIAQNIASLLISKGHSCLFINYGQDNLSFISTENINIDQPQDYGLIFKNSHLDITQEIGILHLWSLDIPSSDNLSISTLETAQKLGCQSVLFLLQELVKHPIKVKMWLTTQNTQQEVNNSQSTNNLAFAQIPLWGMGKVLSFEHPEYFGGLIDLSKDLNSDEIENFVNKITHEDPETEVSLRNNKIYVSRLTQVKNLSLPNTFNSLLPNGSYLITGGLGSLGLKIAQTFVENGAKNLILVGRNKPKAEALKIISDLEKKDVKILVSQTDITDSNALTQLLTQINENLPPLKGIIHSAGILNDNLLLSQNWEQFSSVLAPKIQGTWNLHQLTKTIPLDFFILFSSAASLLGSPAQGNYSSANAFLDGIAAYRHQLNLPALSINWGAWGASGMAVSNRLAVKGIKLIPIKKGLEIFTKLLYSQTPQMGVISIDWDEVVQQFPQINQLPYFEEILEEQDLISIAETQVNLVEQLLKYNAEERETHLILYLKNTLGNILQIDSNNINENESLLDLGMDSLMVMEAITQLKNDLQLMLYPREFYERPKINSLAKYLALEFTKQHDHLIDNNADNYQSNSFPETTQNKKPKIIHQKPTNKIKKPVIFILSSPRSGSTLLRVMLAGHPLLSSPPELHLLPFNDMKERAEELSISYLGEGLQRALMELQQIDAPTAQNLVEKFTQENKSIQEVYQYLLDGVGDKLLIDKSPTYANDLETLNNGELLFENAKYIHLVRHPYSVIESFTRLRMDKLVGEEGNPYKIAENIWSESNKNTLEFLSQIDNSKYHLVYYEELVKQPRLVMENLCDFLEIPFDENVLNPYQGDRMTDGIYNKSMSVGDPNFLKHKDIDPTLADTWKEISLPYKLSDFACDLAHSLSYELPNDFDLDQNHYEMTETLINIRGLNLCLCRWGSEKNPLIFCLHGILEHGATWSEVAWRLVRKGYQVVAPDLRGHGKSDHIGKEGSYNLLDFLGDLDAIANQITDQPFTLVGHSFGSILAAIFTSIRPQKVKNLVLVEPVIPAQTNENETLDQLNTHLDYLASPPEHPIFPDVETAAKRLKQATPALSDDLALKLAKRITHSCEGGVCWLWDAFLRTRAGIEFNGISRQKYLGILKTLKTLITLIYGENSEFNRKEDLDAQQKAMPNAKRHRVSGGHNLHFDAPVALAEIIGNL